MVIYFLNIKKLLEKYSPLNASSIASSFGGAKMPPNDDGPPNLYFIPTLYSPSGRDSKE